ncbi:MAG: ATP-binding protein, partial [Halobacteriales archaeon]
MSNEPPDTPDEADGRAPPPGAADSDPASDDATTDEPAPAEPGADDPAPPAEERADGDQLGSEVEVEGDAEVAETVEDDDLLGGLTIDSTDDISVPDRLIDQVIGQDHARDVIMKAAKQHRHVMMIGSPGTGKSMLAKAMTELLP